MSVSSRSRRLSTLVKGRESRAFDASVGDEARLANLGYEQGGLSDEASSHNYLTSFRAPAQLQPYRHVSDHTFVLWTTRGLLSGYAL